jgi:hypothetical protein
MKEWHNVKIKENTYFRIKDLQYYLFKNTHKTPKLNEIIDLAVENFYEKIKEGGN